MKKLISYFFMSCFLLTMSKRRFETRHTVTAGTAHPKALPKKTTSSGSNKQIRAPQSMAKTKEASRKTENRSTEDTSSQRALSTEPASSEHYELSPTMAAALNEELNVIMEKLEQVLPKAASNPTQRYVLDKMKQEVCADFCNVLGLNVAKRTLNVHNGLYVKIKFDREVPANTLRSLRKHHNILQMRAVANCPTTYVAVMKDFTDFDALCFTKDTKIDEYKFTTTPCYRFTKCTDNLMYKNFVKTPKMYIPTKIIEDKTAIAQKTLKTTNMTTKNNEQITEPAQKTPLKTKSSDAIAKNKPNVASVNKVTSEKQANSLDKQVSNGDKNKLESNESSSHNTQNQMREDLIENTIASQDIAEFLADGIVVDECMGSDDDE